MQQYVIYNYQTVSMGYIISICRGVLCNRSVLFAINIINVIIDLRYISQETQT